MRHGNKSSESRQPTNPLPSHPQPFLTQKSSWRCCSNVDASTIKPCPKCGGTLYHVRPWSEAVCSTCHPPLKHGGNYPPDTEKGEKQT